MWGIRPFYLYTIMYVTYFTHVFITHFSDIIIPSVSIALVRTKKFYRNVGSAMCTLLYYILFFYMYIIIMQFNFISARKIFAREENNE